MAKINVLNREVGVIVENEEDYICITDIARYKNAGNTDDLIRSWLRNRNTVEFPGIWEQLNNPDFNPVQFDGFRKQAGLNSFTLTPKQWIGMTHARGIVPAYQRRKITSLMRKYLKKKAGDATNNPPMLWCWRSP